MAGGSSASASSRSNAVYDRLAAPVLAYAERLATVQGEDVTDLQRHAATLLDRFAADLQRAKVIPSTIQPARLALALIVDMKARTNRAHDARLWAAGAHRYLFDGREVSASTVQEFRHKAAGAGPEFEGVQRFLEKCLGQIDGQRRKFDTNRGTNLTGIVVVVLTAFVVSAVGWAGYQEWRFHRDLTAVFDAEAMQIGLDRAGAIPDLAHRLDQLASVSGRVRRETDRMPFALFAEVSGHDAAARARAVYLAAVQQHLPDVLARGVDLAIASDGDPVRLYDTLRAWQILSGTSVWSADYLAGWSVDQSGSNPALSGLMPHVRWLQPPADALPRPDADLLAQASAFAAEASEPERAFLELRRSQGAAGLADWYPDRAIPGLSDVMQRRSGKRIGDPVSGLFTAAGWDYARDFGTGLAVQTARDAAAQMFTAPPAPRNDTPDVVTDLLQQETLARWKALLDDLRVRSFSDVETSVLVSGRLAQSRSPLEALLREIWAQAGGNDRRRTHAQQLTIAAEFAAMIQYIEQGRMTEIATLFAGLNVALGATDREEDRGQQRLMSVRDRAQSVAALRVAPRIVVQIVEDTLAQTGAAHTDLLSNPLTKAWQTEALSACTEATAGRFPFADGADAEPDAVARVLAPDGILDRFFRRRAEPLLDTSEVPWRWKPEARFAGLSPDSAVFFQRSQALASGLFGPSGAVGTEMTLTALAERGQSFISIGGRGGPVQATSDSLRLAWPGPEPEKGVDVSFRTPEGEARLTETGTWGLLRLLGHLRLRERDGGRRFLVDLRSGGARLFVEIGFAAESNPLSARNLLSGFACPPVL